MPLHLLMSLVWWTNIQNIMKGTCFSPHLPSVIFTSDASMLGCGAHLNNNLLVKVHWSSKKTKKQTNPTDHYIRAESSHTNSKVISFSGQTQSSASSSRQYDTAISSEPAGWRWGNSLCMQLKRLWKWCIEHDVHRIAILVMREQNTPADHLSMSDSHVVFER